MINYRIAAPPLLIALSVLLAGCSGKKREPGFDLFEIEARGVIRAAMPWGSASYFLYRMEPMGDEYEEISRFAASRGLELRIVIAGMAETGNMLRRGEVDVVAFPMPNDRELYPDFIFCGRETMSRPSLVQAVRAGGRLVTGVAQLAGREVYVIAGSHHHKTLAALNERIDGEIIIRAISPDSATVESLIDDVYRGRIPCVVADDRVAFTHKAYYGHIDASLSLDAMSRSSWMVRRSSPLLAEAINAWAERQQERGGYKIRNKRLYELSRMPPDYSRHAAGNGSISPYDSLFMKHASSVGWDWRMLASLAYQESRFNPGITARTGASGLMGVMPRTAESLGAQRDDLFDAETNIIVAVEVIRRFGRSFRHVRDSIQRIKLTLASYNAGVGHVQDACRLAGKYGKDSTVWDGNVADYILLKRDPLFYADPLCRFGYLRGTETFLYVREVIERYKYYCGMI
jgi:membrane-bound lytic murein transglycosylase F